MRIGILLNRTDGGSRRERIRGFEANDFGSPVSTESRVDKNAANGDVRGTPDKKIAKLNIATPGNAEQQLKQQGGGSSPDSQK